MGIDENERNKTGRKVNTWRSTQKREEERILINTTQGRKETTWIIPYSCWIILGSPVERSNNNSAGSNSRRSKEKWRRRTKMTDDLKGKERYQKLNEAERNRTQCRRVAGIRVLPLGTVTTYKYEDVS